MSNRRIPVAGLPAGKETDSIRAALALTKFDEELNRFMLVVKMRGRELHCGLGRGDEDVYGRATPRRYQPRRRVRGKPVHGRLRSRGCRRGRKAGLRNETDQANLPRHEGKDDMAAAVERTEKEREPLVAAIKAAFTPVTHTLRIVEVK